MTTDLEDALIEWRDAREVIFAQPPGQPCDWTRLGAAEHVLMEIARSIDTTTPACEDG
jgi:hypothetical protein